MAIRNQVFLIFTVIIALIVGVGVYAVNVGEASLSTSIDQKTTAQARGMMLTVDKTIYDRMELFREYTRDLIFQEALEYANCQNGGCGLSREKAVTPGSTFDKKNKITLLNEELSEKLEYYEKRYGFPIFFEVLVIDADGNVITRAGKEKHFDDPDYSLSDSLRRQLVSAEPRVDSFKSDDIHIDISFPVTDEVSGVSKGALFLSINLQDILLQLDRTLHADEGHVQHQTMHYSLLDRDNRIIFTTLSMSRGENAQWMIRSTDKPTATSGSKIINDNQYVYVTSRGYLDFKGLGWKTVIHHDLKEVFAPIDKLRYSLIAVIGLVALIALMTALVTSRLIVRPIMRLTDSADEIARGDLGKSITIEAGGEIKKLIDTFNHMGEELRKSKKQVTEEIKKSRAAALALQQNEKRMSAITDSAQDAIIMIDNDSRIIFANPAASKILGYSHKELLGHLVHPLIAPDRFKPLYEKGFKAFRTTGKGGAIGKTVELAARHKDGHELPIEISLSSVHFNDSWHAIGIIRDISERKANEIAFKEQEEIMIAQSRQAAMGEMISMIAHQWRQPITVIAMSVNNLKIADELGEEITREKLHRAIDTVSHQVQHLSKTIDDFRNFFKPDKIKEDASVSSIIEDTIKIIGKSLENNDIRLSIDEDSDAKISTHPNELVQVFLNLIGNAKDAILQHKPDVPEITISISKSGRNVLAVICDNGGGISETNLSKIGQPYFSTKEAGGTGLGLYMSKTIIQKHLGGKLSWHNTEQGACFTVTLPVGEEKDRA